MLQDSIIVFTTDNGGPAAGFDLNYASNWPLRGVSQAFQQSVTILHFDNADGRISLPHLFL